MTRSIRAVLAATVSAGALLLHADLASAQAGPPDYLVSDPFGVNVVTGGLSMTMPDVVIGQPGQSGMAFVREMRDGGMYFNFTGAITQSGSRYRVVIGGSSDVFDLTGSTFTSATGQGGTLTYNSGSGIYTYTAPDGTVATFSEAYAGVYNNDLGGPQITSLQRPDGEVLTYSYSGFEFRTCPQIYCPLEDGYRLDQVTTSLGWAIYLQYESDVEPTDFSGIPAWFRIKGVSSSNQAASTAGLTVSSIAYSQDAIALHQDVTDQSGRTTQFLSIPNGFAIRDPGETANRIAYTFTAPNMVQIASVTTGGGVWNYAYGYSGLNSTVTVTDPASNTTVYASSLTTGRLVSVTDPLERTTSFEYDELGRTTRVTRPEGDYTEYVYDDRGNITETTYTPKPGSDLDPIVVSSSYAATCANPVTCNLPASTTDARGAVTDYTYDPDHGGVLTVTAPAPEAGAARPQTRFTYSELSPGGGADPVTRLTRISQCATGASCLNTAQEIRTEFAYTAASPRSNLFIASVTQRSGDGALSATTAMTTNALGDATAIDGPLAGSGDSTHYRYDNARQMVGVIGPDPDGAGPLLRRATRLTYRPAGQVILAEQGTVTGLTDPNWAAFVPLQRQATQRDTLGRATHIRAQAGDGTTHGLTQIRYDSLGRLDCVATRMNPSTFASPPASACSLAATGAFGHDRITRYAYDAAGQVTGVTSGHNSSDPITQALTWTDSGRVQTAQDGDGNLSTWEYDGFDRVRRLRFPTGSGGSSSTTDYVEYGYDPGGNAVSYRTRAGQTFVTEYDALNRRTLLDAPAPMADTEYGYDNLGRLTSASQPGHAMSWTWDGLSRLTSQADPFGTYGFQYDLAGRRTRITWPDTFYAQYDWNLYDQMTAVRENGAASGAGVLAQYGYDNLGRRSGITRGNGVSTAYDYDAISRVTSIAHDLAGTADEVTFALAWNPAGQITSRTISNDLYAYQPGNEDAAYTINSRNEITSVDGTTLDYDGNRNLTFDGVRSFGYDAANRMLNVGNSNFSYDPAGNLYQAGNALLLSMVGGERLALHRLDDGTINRRIIPGPGLDEPAGYYHGIGTSSSARRWPLADQLGSIIAYTDASGDAAVVNTYDEYGRGGPANAERLQYTGQFTLNASLDLINYRNRFYNPRLGRFFQTDPIMYGGGLNLYGYVGNDPMNSIDPWGLIPTVQEVVITAKPFDPLTFTRTYRVDPGGWPGILSGTVAFFGGAGSSAAQADPFAFIPEDQRCGYRQMGDFLANTGELAGLASMALAVQGTRTVNPRSKPLIAAAGGFGAAGAFLEGLSVVSSAMGGDYLAVNETLIGFLFGGIARAEGADALTSDGLGALGSRAADEFNEFIEGENSCQ